MDEAHLGAALRYVALNPVIFSSRRARLVRRATDWPWSSAHALLGHVADDGLTATAPVRERYPDFAELIAAGEDEAGEDGATVQRLRRSESIGRPLGAEAFTARLEAESGRTLRPGKRGPKGKAAAGHS